MELKTPLTAKYLYSLLELKQAGDNVDRIGTTLFNSRIKLTPHQIEAALFAFKSPINKGCILADEVGLGKTIEAGIILAQYWSEHKRKILIVTPASLMRQWEAELYDKFNLPSIIMDRKNFNLSKKKGIQNPFIYKDKIIICSYQMCAASFDEIKLASYDLCVIDEAHKLRNVWTGKNVVSQSIKDALSETKKILLTATPIQNNVMDMYGLTSLIDDNIFGDSQVYKEKYYKNYSENYLELRNRISYFTHRTLREQVKPYIKFTKRIPRTYAFAQTPDEIKVYDKIRELLLNSDEESYLIPNKQKHLLLIILCKLMGSSVHSIVYTLEVMKDRLETLLKTGIDKGLDVLVSDEDIDYEESDEFDEKPIDVEKLKFEISNLTDIIETAKKVKIESKYLALKDSINYGFEYLKNLKANEKILIFTESRRTQKYLYDSLVADGYEEVLVFNGSNTDEISTKIYENWCRRTENIDKLNNSKSINMRQAIIDYFREEGRILIATGAGAEGLNLQFCSMVVNYDLPWNPQVVEQRIGRCHRFGQEHDVAVINFISSNNVVEQRIYELLSSKFRVFNEIFGSSDSILGTLEDGIDLQQSIIDIYTKCRTVEEINSAFDKIQEQYKDVIDESMEKTKKELLENFDEDLQTYFADMLDNTKASISKIEALFWRLTKIVLWNNGIFDDKSKTFVLDNENYILSADDFKNFINYNMITPLGVRVLDCASKIINKEGAIKFDISNYPFQITNIKELKGKKGYLSFNKLTINSFETCEHVFFTGYLEDGTQLDEDTLSKLFRLETYEENGIIDQFYKDRLILDANQYAKKIIIESEEKNNQLLNDEITKINKWAEDKIESVQLKVEQMRNERKNLQKQSDIAESTYEREKIEEEILKLSKKIKLSWLELADAEDEIELQRKNMISKLRSQVMKATTLETIFSASFEII